MGWIMERHALKPSILPLIANLFNDPAKFALLRAWFQRDLEGRYAFGDIEAVVFNVPALADDLNLPDDKFTHAKWQRWVAFLRAFYAPAARHADRETIHNTIAEVLGDKTNTKRMSLSFVASGYQAPVISVQGNTTTLTIYY